MKRFITVCLLCVLLCGCTVTPEITASIAPTVTQNVTDPLQTGTAGATEGTTENVTQGTTESVTENITQGATQETEPGITSPSDTVTAGPTASTSVNTKPTATAQANTVLENFDSGSLGDLVSSLDWESAGYPIANPQLALTSQNTDSGRGLKVTLPSQEAWCQNLIIKNNKVVTAFKNHKKYFRIWINNSTGGDMEVGVALFASDSTYACFGVTNAVLTDTSGVSHTLKTGDPSNMGSGTHTAVTVPDEFVGWLAFDVTQLVSYWDRSKTKDITKVNQICIDVRLYSGFVDGLSYVLDDICFSNSASGQIITTQPTPTYTKDPNQFEIIGPAAGSVDIYSGQSTDLLVGIDQFGRTFDVQVGEKSNKEVGMFFWLWNGYHRAHNQQNGNYDASKILEQYGINTLFKESSSVSPAMQFHFWGEPLWGYYDQRDEWVIRRQMELLTDAGVDFIVFDTTNGWSYYDVYIKVCKVISEMMADGANPPKVAFYTHSMSLMVIQEVYRDLYKANKYPETWYRINGKPLIIGYTTVADDMAEAASRGDTSYNANSYALSSEILNFFTFRRPQWPGDPYNADGFPWIEWKYPQPMYNGGVMNVSVASHPEVPMSFSLTRGAKNWGRGYNVTTKQNVSADVEKGTFFQSQWNTVHAEDPNIVFVDGWNEWIAFKSEWLGEYMLCDAASMEYSRDIEMMKGGYNDAFYIQLIQNIRKYKGKALNGTVSSTQKSIDIFGNVAQWDTVNSVYEGVALKSIARNHASAGDPNVVYTQAAARNNIQRVKVTRDADNFYFFIECKSNITGIGQNYMNLFIGTGSVSQKGWNGYEYVINRKISGNTSEIWKLDQNFNGTKVGSAKVNVSGKYMQIEVPRSAIGMQNSNAFYFKVADNVTNPSDIMDYYVSGKSFPLGRLSYQYLG